MEEKYINKILNFSDENICTTKELIINIVANDILEEEKEQILKDIARIIKKQAIPNIKEYVDNN